MSTDPMLVPLARVERRKIALAKQLYLLAVAGIPLYCVAGIWVSHLFRAVTWNGIPMFAVALMPLWLSIAALVVSRRRAVPAESVRVDGTTLTFEGQSAIQRSALTGGAVVPGEPPSVTVETQGGDQWFLTPSTAGGAQALLAALGLDASKHTWETTAHRSFPRALLWLCSPFALIAGGAGAVSLSKALQAGPIVTGLAAFAGVCASLAALLWADRIGLATKVTVGTDGVAVRRRGRTRVYGLAGLVSIDARSEGRLALSYEGGATQVIGFHPEAYAQTAALVRRIEEAIDARKARTDGEGAQLASALARQGRSFSEWRGALGGLLERAEGYRTATVTREDLRALVTNAVVPIEQRVAAVLSLAQSKDPEVQARVRVAVDSAAVPRVRVALERAASGALEEGELEDAVEAERAARKAGASR